MKNRNLTDGSKWSAQQKTIFPPFIEILRGYGKILIFHDYLAEFNHYKDTKGVGKKAKI